MSKQESSMSYMMIHSGDKMMLRGATRYNIKQFGGIMMLDTILAFIFWTIGCLLQILIRNLLFGAIGYIFKIIMFVFKGICKPFKSKKGSDNSSSEI
jgi:hypothetical protein